MTAAAHHRVKNMLRDTVRRDPGMFIAVGGFAANKKAGPNGPALHKLAEREGFEPSVRYKRTPDFESGTFNHSATSPEVGRE